jgi:hypothetical protein
MDPNDPAAQKDPRDPADLTGLRAPADPRDLKDPKDPADPTGLKAPVVPKDHEARRQAPERRLDPRPQLVPAARAACGSPWATASSGESSGS